MSLSKQLYLIISFIFLMIFVGNTIITIQHTREYLELESTTKAQDTATSLGMILKSFISNKKDPEITSTIDAIADSGFYSQIRLEDSYYTFTDKELLENNNHLKGLLWDIKNVSVDKQYGNIIVNTDNDLENKLDKLENLDNLDNTNNNKIVDHTYTFIPTNKFKDNDILDITFEAIKGDKYIKTTTSIKMSKILVKTTRPVKFDTVPSWFIKFITMKLEEKKSEINDGWKTAAVIYVKANAGIAYFKLYEQVKDAIVYSIFSFIIAIILLILFLRLILKPLNDVEKLAIKISNGSFAIITKLPWTKELKSVSIAMNIMSNKIKAIISKLNNNIKDVSVQLTKDQLTSLSNKQVFEKDLKEIFLSKQKAYMFIAQISNLGEYSKVNGRNSVNNFLIEFANILDNINGVNAYRFYGSEFAMLAKNMNYDEAKKISKELTEKFNKLGKKINKPDIANIGAVPFGQLDNFGTVLSGASEAYEMAKQIGPNEIFVKEKNKQARGMLEWKELVFDIIDNEKINIDYIGNIKTKKDNYNTVIVQEAFANMLDKDDKSVPIGIFLSIAEENHKVIDFDKIIINKVINYIYTNNIKHQISINLSIDSIKDVEFLSWLKDIIIKNKMVAHQLIFSLTEYNISNNMNIFKEFVKLIHNQNSQIMIKRFDMKFIQMEQIKDINPDCIRLARDYTNGISEDLNKKSLVDSVCKISELLDIKVYTEIVQNDSDFEVIKSLDIDGLCK